MEKKVMVNTETGKDFEALMKEAEAYLNGSNDNGEAVLRFAEVVTYCIYKKAFTASGSVYMLRGMNEVLSGASLRKSEERINYTKENEVFLEDFEEVGFFDDFEVSEVAEKVQKAKEMKTRLNEAKKAKKEAEDRFIRAFMRKAEVLEKSASNEAEKALAEAEKALAEAEAEAENIREYRTEALEEKSEAEIMPEAYDTVLEVAKLLMEEAEEEKARFGSVSFLRSFEKTEVRRKVVIKEGAEEETFTTCGLREVWKAGRRFINSLGQKRVNTKIYVNTEKEGVYRRLPSYFSGLASFADSVVNKAKTPYISEAEAESMEELIFSLNLTASQSEAFNLLLRGYGIKAVATKLRVSHQAIAKKRKEIMKKALLSEEVMKLFKKYNVTLEA